MFTAALFTTAEIWKQPKCPTTDEYIYTYIYDRYIHIYIYIYIWNFAIFSNMDELGGHYAKWNKSDRERQILYDTLICEI